MLYLNQDSDKNQKLSPSYTSYMVWNQLFLILKRILSVLLACGTPVSAHQVKRVRGLISHVILIIGQLYL